MNQFTSPSASGQGSALVNAVSWVQGLLLGPVATALAVLAVAAVGFAMLQGRIAYRDGVRVVIGCFVLFGAMPIAAALRDLAHRSSGPAVIYSAPEAMPPIAVPNPPKPNPNPYAGASLPM